MTQQEHHYYAASFFGWAVAPTRAEAVERLARDAGASLIREQVKANDGLYVWTCRVDLPSDATYDINFYKPTFITEGGMRTDKPVPLSHPVEGMIQNIKGHIVIGYGEDKA